MHKPIISVVMPVYNSEKYVEETINSVLNQTFSDFELICVNHSSTDNSLSILNKKAEEDTRISVYTVENKGYICNGYPENFGVQQAVGEYLCFIDSDDLYEPNFLEKMYNGIFEKNLNACICNASYYINGEKGERVKMRKLSSDNIVNLKKIKDKKQLKCTYFPQWCKIIRRDFYQKYNILFPTKAIKTTDVAMHYQLIFALDKICIIKDSLYKYRIHTMQTSVDIAKFAPLDCIRCYDFLNEWGKNNQEIDYDKFKQWIKYLLMISFRDLKDKENDQDVMSRLKNNYSFLDSRITIMLITFKRYFNLKKWLKQLSALNTKSKCI